MRADVGGWGWLGGLTFSAVIPVAPLCARDPGTNATTLVSVAVRGTVGTVTEFAAPDPGARFGTVDPSASDTALQTAVGIAVIVDSDRESESLVWVHAVGSAGLGAVVPGTACNWQRREQCTPI